MTTEPSDLVERLRQRTTQRVCSEAADELTRLRTQVEAMAEALNAAAEFAERGHPLRAGFAHSGRTRHELEEDMLSIAATVRQALSTYRKTQGTE